MTPPDRRIGLRLLREATAGWSVPSA